MSCPTMVASAAKIPSVMAMFLFLQSGMLSGPGSHDGHHKQERPQGPRKRRDRARLHLIKRSLGIFPGSSSYLGSGLLVAQGFDWLQH